MNYYVCDHLGRHSIWACLTILMVSTSILLAANSAKADQSETTCYRGEKGREDTLSPCRLGWNFSADTSGTTYWVQRLEIAEDGLEWITVDGPYSANPARLQTTAEGGFLYRVVACDDAAREPSTSCASSTAIWAPTIVSTYTEIPQFLELKDGSNVAALAAHNPEEEPLDMLNIEYNLALVYRLVSYGKVDELPTLTGLEFENVHHLPDGISKWDAYLDYNVRRQYPVNSIDSHVP